MQASYNQPQVFKVPMIRFLLLKLNIAPFHSSEILVKHDKTYATNSRRSEICIHNSL